MAYIDKINPNLLQGRIVVTPKGIVLKDPSAPRVKEPLQNRYRNLIDYIDTDLFPKDYVEAVMAAYEQIKAVSAFGQVGAYNKILASHPEHREPLARWLAYDLYGLLPSPPKLYLSNYDLLNHHYRKMLDDAMKAAKDDKVSDLTISVEASIVASFFIYLQQNKVKVIGDLTEKIVQNYPSHRHCGPNIVYRIGLFLKRLASKTQDPVLLSKCIFFPREKMMRKVYDAFTRDDRTTLEEFLLDDNCPLSKRDRAITTLMFYTGMRSKDVRNLHLDSIDWGRRSIRFKQGKTGVEVLLPLRPVVGNYIYDYIKEERPKCDSPLCFLSLQNRYGQYNPVSIGNVINQVYHAAGIRKGDARKGTHLLRHSLADEMMNSGSDITIVAKMLGHLHPNTTLGYLSSNIEQLRRCALSIEKYPVKHKLYCNE